MEEKIPSLEKHSIDNIDSTISLVFPSPSPCKRHNKNKKTKQQISVLLRITHKCKSHDKKNLLIITTTQTSFFFSNPTSIFFVKFFFFFFFFCVCCTYCSRCLVKYIRVFLW